MSPLIQIAQDPRPSWTVWSRSVHYWQLVSLVITFLLSLVQQGALDHCLGHAAVAASAIGQGDRHAAGKQGDQGSAEWLCATCLAYGDFVAMADTDIVSPPLVPADIGRGDTSSPLAVFLTLPRPNARAPPPSHI
jgi:hypothetical protein